MPDVLQKPADPYDPRGRLDPAGFAQHVRFQTAVPPPDLAPFIEHFWVIRWDESSAPYFSEEVMHRPYVDVFVSAQESGIQGTFRGKRTYVAAGVGRIIGARFRPGAFHAFWDGPLADLQDNVVELERAFPSADPRFVEGLLALEDEPAIGALVALLRAKHPHPDANIELINAIIATVEAEDGPQTVMAVAKAFARSERWLQQLFQDYVGIGLKWLLQRQKLLAAARRIRESPQPDFAAVAYETGYSSQQHFNADFKRALGKTPLQYKKGLQHG